MKKFHPTAFLVLLASFMLSVTLSAQETKVSVKVEKDGKTVKDTTYTYEDADQADHLMKIIEVMSGDEAEMMKMHADMEEVHGAHSNSYVFISEDGEKTEIRKMSGDSLVWISEGEHDGEHTKVMKYTVEDGDCVKTKKITVMVSDDKDGEWEVTSDDGEEVEVIVVKKKVHKDELHEAHEHEDVEVEVEKEVTKKKSKKQ